MKMSTKVTAAAVAALIIFAAGATIYLNAEHANDKVTGPENTVASRSDFAAAKARRGANTLLGQENTNRRSADNLLLANAAGLEIPSPFASANSNVTVLRARILGDDMKPLANATLSSIHSDGSARGLNNVARSDEAGRVVLELADKSLRKSRDQLFDMLFAAGAVLYASDSVVAEDLDALSFSGPNFQGAIPRTTSAADGSFELSGITVDVLGDASARIWGHTRGHPWTLTAPFTMTPRSRIDIGNVILTKESRSRRVEGVVLQPDGVPAANARVDYLRESMPPHGQVQTDKDSRFVVLAKDDEPMEFIARYSKGAFGMSPTRVAKRGETVNLRLPQRQLISVTVTDLVGEPVSDTLIMPVLNGANSSPKDATRLTPGEKWSYTDQDGEIELAIPSQRFSVTVRRTGFGSKTLGPFDYDSAPESLTIRLPRGAEVQGRVLAYGKPVEGATVAVMRRHTSFVAMTGGFANRYPSGVTTVKTDSDGRFESPIKKSWTTVGVVARFEGLASAEITFQVQADEQVYDVKIEMTKGVVVDLQAPRRYGSSMERLRR